MSVGPVLVVGDDSPAAASIAERCGETCTRLPTMGLLDPARLYEELRRTRPTVVFQVAALDRGADERPPTTALELLVVGSANLFEAIRLADLDPTVVVVSTEAAFGSGDADRPSPATPAAVAQTGQALLAATYVANRGTRLRHVAVPVAGDGPAVAAVAWAAAG